MSKTTSGGSSIGCGCLLLLLFLMAFFAYAGLRLAAVVFGPLAGQ